MADLFSGLKLDSRTRDKLPRLDLDQFTSNNYLVHGFHPYSAKFIPQIPRAVIGSITDPGAIVFDPFCGSGTTLVESLLLERKAIGVDLNPIACLISRTKTATLTPRERVRLEELVRHLGSVAVSGKGLQVAEQEEIGKFEFLNKDKWFKPYVLEELGFLKRKIAEIGSEKARDFANVVLSAIVVSVSNQEGETRWKAIEKDVARGETLIRFRERLKRHLRLYEEFRREVPSEACARVYWDDAREMRHIEPGVADAVITSPPYMNSYDYYLYHKLRMFILGYDHRKVQEGEIGSRNKHNDMALSIDDFVGDMKTCLRNIKVALKANGYLCLIVGDSIWKGRLIKMDKVYRQVCAEVDFAELDCVSYDQRRYTRTFHKGYKKIPKETHIMLFGRN